MKLGKFEGTLEAFGQEVAASGSADLMSRETDLSINDPSQVVEAPPTP